MKLSRKQVILAVAFLLIVPAMGWVFLYTNGYVAAPGKPVVAPFNMSDRIATIDVEKNAQGELVATFDGWTEGASPLTADQFYAELYKRKKDLPPIYKWLDVTSVAGVIWVIFGGLAQLVFTGRMIVQWYASEKAGASIVPVAFWWLSLLGASMLMVYFIWRKEPIGLLGQVTGWFVYVRNLWLIYGQEEKCKESYE